MRGKTGNYILIGMVLGAIIGTLGGYFFGDIFIEIKFLGTIFLNALKMVVIPLIVASIIVGVSSLGDIRKLGRTSAKTLKRLNGCIIDLIEKVGAKTYFATSLLLIKPK